MMQFPLIAALLLAPSVLESAGTPVKEGMTDPDAVVCHLTTEPGSRIAIRVCRTKAEWSRIEQDSQKDLSDARRPRGACQINQSC